MRKIQCQRHSPVCNHCFFRHDNPMASQVVPQGRHALHHPCHQLIVGHAQTQPLNGNVVRMALTCCQDTLKERLSKNKWFLRTECQFRMTKHGDVQDNRHKLRKIAARHNCSKTTCSPLPFKWLARARKSAPPG